MKLCFLCAACMAAVPAGLASAEITELEPNDSIANANPIDRDPGIWADVGLMALGGDGGDVDYFAIDLVAGESMIVTVTPFDNIDFTDPDTILGVFDVGGTMLAFDDNGGVGNGSLLVFAPDTSDTYYIGISGGGDDDFNGDHGESGTYSLSVRVVPVPATLALLSAAGLVAGRRRRRS